MTRAARIRTALTVVMCVAALVVSGCATLPDSSSPQAIGTILGGHGITAWGATSDEAEALKAKLEEVGAKVELK